MQYSNIAAAATLVVAAGPATLGIITVNKATATSTLTVYDNATVGSGTKIATIDASVAGSYAYFVRAKRGITVVMATANSDCTICFD